MTNRLRRFLSSSSAWRSRTLPSLAQEPVKLRASVVAKTFGFAPLWVASKQGFFNQQKLDVEVLLIRGSDVSTQALAGGSLQVSGASSDAPIAAFDRGLDMVIIGGIINGLSQSIMAGKKYKTYDDLRGATLGANSLTAGTAFAFRRVLKAKGLEYPQRLQADQCRGNAASAGGPGIRADRCGAAFIAGQFRRRGTGVQYHRPVYRRDSALSALGLFGHAAVGGEKSRRRCAFHEVDRIACRWISGNKEAAVELLAKEMGLKREYARKGWDFYTEKGLWNPVGRRDV